jgi:hypothetical protein
MNDYLAKPVRQIALREMLDSYLSNKPPNAVVDGEIERVEPPADQFNSMAENAPNQKSKPVTNGVDVDATTKETKKPTANGVVRKRPTIRSSRDNQLKIEALGERINRSTGSSSGVRETEVRGRLSSETAGLETLTRVPAVAKIDDGGGRTANTETKSAENAT